MLISGSLVIKRAFLLSKKLFSNLKIWIHNVKKNKLRGLENIITNELYCIGCKNQIKSIINLPCYHYNYCESCFKHLGPKKCPTCRKSIKDFLNIYIV